MLGGWHRPPAKQSLTLLRHDLFDERPDLLPFGVIARRESDGGAHKCTLCYDRIGDALTPACAKACPTESIQFGPLDELRERAQLRVTELHDAGRAEAHLYLADPDDGIGGAGAFFLLLDQPEVYGLPPDPVVTRGVGHGLFLVHQ